MTPCRVQDQNTGQVFDMCSSVPPGIRPEGYKPAAGCGTMRSGFVRHAFVPLQGRHSLGCAIVLRPLRKSSVRGGMRPEGYKPAGWLRHDTKTLRSRSARFRPTAKTALARMCDRPASFAQKLSPGWNEARRVQTSRLAAARYEAVSFGTHYLHSMAALAPARVCDRSAAIVRAPNRCTRRQDTHPHLLAGQHG